MNKREISAVLKSQFNLTADVQVIPVKGENRTLYQLERIPFGRRMTMAGLERLCRRIAKALDAELYGTVNLDFADSGDAGTFAMMAEAEGATEDFSAGISLHEPRRVTETDVAMHHQRHIGSVVPKLGF